MSARLRSIIAFILFAIALPACAATGNLMTTGSGGTQSSSESALLRDERAQRTKDFLESFAAFQKSDLQWREKQAAYERKRVQHRADCRDQLRRANKDTYFGTLLLCYRGELTLEEEHLPPQRTYLAGMPGVSPDIRSHALDRLDVLADALKTIVFAIDSGVYTSANDLTEAKQNLYSRYRIPFQDSLAVLRAGRTLAWVEKLILDLDAVKAEETAKNGSANPSWDTGRLCLTENEATLKTLLGTDVRDRAASLAKLLPVIQKCIQKISSVPAAAMTGSGAGTAPSSSSAAIR